MKKIIFLVISLLLLSHVCSAQTATEFINDLVNNVVKNVLTTQDSTEKKKEIFNQYMVENIDIKAIARTSLGPNWRKASEQEKEAFTSAFKNMLLDMSVERFKLYKGQNVEFSAERPAQGKNQLFVESSVSGDNKPLQVVWRVRFKDGSYKVLDIIVEGVSMALSYRNEYASFLQAHSIQELIEELKKQPLKTGQ